jgi:hypothetical protein
MLPVEREVTAMTNGFQRQEAEALFARLSAQIDQDARERDRLAASIAGMEQIINGLRGLFPDINGGASGGVTSAPVAKHEGTTPSSGSQRPEGLSSIQIAARVVDDMTFGHEAAVSVSQVVNEMESRGWLPEATDPTAAVRTALTRARAQGLIESVRLDGRSNGYRRLTNTSGPAEAGPEGDVTADEEGGPEVETPAHDPNHEAPGWNRDRGDHPVDGLTG